MGDIVSSNDSSCYLSCVDNLKEITLIGFNCTKEQAESIFQMNLDQDNYYIFRYSSLKQF